MSKDPAFPTLNSTGESWEVGGLTKREYAAIQIRLGMLAAGMWEPSKMTPERYAVLTADMLLAELEKSDD